MVIQDNVLRKMLIIIDAEKITPKSAQKLNNILLHYEMELTDDGWYTGTNEHCKSVYSLITQDMNIFKSLKQWILWNPSTNSKEDCVKSYLDFLKEWSD